MNTITSTPDAPDESARAARVITDALAESGGTITYATARLIAATLHGGAGTALEHFAAAGQFDPDELGHEVTNLTLLREQEPWRRALLTWVMSVRGNHPFKRSALRDWRRPDRPATPFSASERRRPRN